jgi:GNAT superfamily N-acetyltransferase
LAKVIDVVLRPARPGDAGTCAAIFDAWVDATDWMPRVHPPGDVARHFREFVLPRRAVTVAERGGRVVGFLALGEGHVDGLYLGPEARRQGIGAALVGLTLWTFVANAPARRFYAAQGFVELRRSAGDNEEGIPDVLMAWTGSS